MNVANRKLFANRDARKKLAEMGGILASSPELLGEAQKFANGGEAEVDQYLVVIRGINGGRPIRLSVDTLVRLQDRVPEIMAEAVVMDAESAAAQGIDVMELRPGDAFVERQLTPAAPVPTVQEPVDDRSIRDIVREGLASTYSKSPMEAILENLTPDSENPMVQMVESGLQSLGVEDPNAAISGPSGIATGLTPSQKFQSESLNPMNMGPTELNQPAVRNALRDPNAPSAGLASSLREAAARGPLPLETPAVDQPVTSNIDFPMLLDSIGSGNEPAIRDTLPEVIRNNELLRSRGTSSLGAASDIGIAGLDDSSEATDPTLRSFDALIDRTQRYAGADSAPVIDDPTLQQRAVDTPDFKDLQTYIEAMKRRSNIPGYNLPSEPQTEEEQSIFEMVTQNPLLKGAPGVEEETLELLRQKRDALNIPGLNMPSDSAAAAELDAEIKKVGNTPEAIAAAERLQMAGLTAPKISAEEGAKALQSINEQIKEDPTKLPNKFVIDLMKKNEDAYREAAFGKPDEKKDDSKAPPKPDPEKVIKMSAAEATNEYYKQLKEMFGLSDEDKARDLSLTMAQFGFAMAAGQSPNALTNIANAAGAALAQMRESQATEREREDKLKLLAFTEARADEKEARELDRLLAKETRADKRELALYISKLEAKAELDPDVKTYLETADGKAALSLYKDIIGNELIDAKDVVPTFIQQAGDLAPGFLTYLGLGTETGGNAGGGVTGTGTTMGDIK